MQIKTRTWCYVDLCNDDRDRFSAKTNFLKFDQKPFQILKKLFDTGYGLFPVFNYLFSSVHHICPGHHVKRESTLQAEWKTFTARWSTIRSFPNHPSGNHLFLDKISPARLLELTYLCMLDLYSQKRRLCDNIINLTVSTRILTQDVSGGFTPQLTPSKTTWNQISYAVQFVAKPYLTKCRQIMNAHSSNFTFRLTQ